jgi:MFS family permease
MPMIMVPSLVWRALIPPTTAGRWLALIALIDSLGTGLFLTDASLYFTRFLGLQPEHVGVGLSLAGIFGLLGTLPIGMLADRFGAVRVCVVLQTWRGLGYLAYSLVSSFPAFLAVAACIGLADGAIPAINQAIIGAAVSGEERVDTLAKIRALRNVGFGSGAGLATLAIALGIKKAFLMLVLGNAISFFVAAIMLTRTGLAGAATSRTIPSRETRFAFDARYVAVALLNGVLSVHLSLLTIGLPLWIAGYTKVPVLMIGVLVTINTIMTVALQARFAAPATKISGALACTLRAGLALAACGLIAIFMAQVSIAWLGALLAVLAVVTMTCGELW